MVDFSRLKDLIIAEYNKCHVPHGSKKGGQFCGGKKGNGTLTYKGQTITINIHDKQLLKLAKSYGTSLTDKLDFRNRVYRDKKYSPSKAVMGISTIWDIAKDGNYELR